MMGPRPQPGLFADSFFRQEDGVAEENSREPVGRHGEKLRLIDLFAGCGGLTAGFMSTGRYQPVGAVEQNISAAATYAQNFGDHVFPGDIADWMGEVPEADVVVGGPPCQGFSNLGSRKDHDPRNLLWRRYVDVLVHSRPRAFVLENVPQFAKSAEFQLLEGENLNGKLEDYVLRKLVVRATDYGSPQLRRRLIVIGTRKDLTPIGIPGATVRPHEWRTVRQAIGDLQYSVDPDRTSLPDRTIKFREHEIRGVFTSSELDLARSYSDLTRKRFDAIPEEGDRTSLDEELLAPCWIGRKSGLDVMSRLRWDKPSVTIRTEFFKAEKGRYIHPKEHRTLSHHEAARLQGFSDDFKWCGTKVEIAKQIGNAVPVDLAKALAQHIADRL
jgi:DNA (cytosine-5)-methyltransferase 1